jgi:hypothetical protein
MSVDTEAVPYAGRTAWARNLAHAWVATRPALHGPRALVRYAREPS